MNRVHKGMSELNPLVMVDDKKEVGKNWIVGYTESGKTIPRHYKGGILPRSDHAGVGKINLVTAIAASSNPYFSLLALEHLDDPDELLEAARQFGYGSRTGIELPGETSGNLPKDIAYNRSGLYSFAIGQHTLLGTPLQSAVMFSAVANGGRSCSLRS